MLLVGKLDRRPRGLNSLGNGLIFLKDQKSNQSFLVDTGAAVSVLPHRSNDAPSGPALTGADGKSIASWGKVVKTLCFGAKNYFCTFLLAAVSKPILGVDFLAANRLLVDHSNKREFFYSCHSKNNLTYCLDIKLKV